MIEEIKVNGIVYAIIISHAYKAEGIHFFTPPEFSQQLAYMQRPAGYFIAPHIHNKVHRDVYYTQEVLFIKKGKVKINLFDNDRQSIGYRILESGDVIMLSSGGHGFEMLEPTEMLEVKQGPFTENDDRVRFDFNKE